jgi:hypothetical protein
MRRLWRSFVSDTFENPDRMEGFANFLAAAFLLGIVLAVVAAVSR